MLRGLTSCLVGFLSFLQTADAASAAKDQSKPDSIMLLDIIILARFSNLDGESSGYENETSIGNNQGISQRPIQGTGPSLELSPSTARNRARIANDSSKSLAHQRCAHIPEETTHSIDLGYQGKVCRVSGESTNA